MCVCACVCKGVCKGGGRTVSLAGENPNPYRQPRVGRSQPDHFAPPSDALRPFRFAARPRAASPSQTVREKLSRLARTLRCSRAQAARCALRQPSSLLLSAETVERKVEDVAEVGSLVCVVGV